MLIYVNASDKKNFDYVKTLANTYNTFVFVSKKPFNYNDVFLHAINNTKTDVLLLGDLKVPNLDILFKNCIVRYEEGADIVHIIKKKSGVKKFFCKIKTGFISPFIRLFTNKSEKFNATSLGLIDSDILDILKSLQPKATFLKNTSNFYGFNSRTIFIDDKIPTYAENFKIMTKPLKSSIVCGSIAIISLLLIIFGNLFMTNGKIVLNILSTFALISSIAVLLLLIPKHYLNIRTGINKNVNFKRFTGIENKKRGKKASKI